MIKLESLARYPVKGLGPDYLQFADLQPGAALPCDRVFALAHADTVFDKDAPAYLEKHHFLMLMRNPRLAALETAFDSDTSQFSVTFPDGRPFAGNLADYSARTAFEAAVDEFIGDESRGGPARVVAAEDHRFFDTPHNYLSLINLESVREFAAHIDREVDPLRFRANLYISGLPAWEEAKLIGSCLSVGQVRFRVEATTGRCKATCVNPQTGSVDINVPYLLRKHFNTLDMGVYLLAQSAGRIQVGDACEVLSSANHS